MPSGSGVEVSGETGLNILRTILSEQSNPEDADTADAMPKINFSQEWHQKYFQEIDQFVENHFPKLPTEGPQGSQLEQIQDFLKSAMENDISTTLQKILHYDEEHGNNEDSMDEETFIRVHLDVTQCLTCAIVEAENVGLTLKHAPQILCSGEVHVFVQKYVDAENKCLKKQKFTEKNSV